MASFLQKFIRGAATTGGQLYADQAREEMRAGIMAKRDEVLNTNRQNIDQQRQEFQAGESEKQRTAQQNSSQQQLADLKLQNAQGAALLNKQYKEAKTDEERQEIAKQIMAAQGKPVDIAGGATKITADEQKVKALVADGAFKTKAEAWKFLKGGNKNLAVTIFKMLVEQQDSAFVQPSDPTYRTMQEMLDASKRMAKGDNEQPITPDTTDAEPNNASTTDTTDAEPKTISTQAAYDALASKAIYVNSADGKEYRKP